MGAPSFLFSRSESGRFSSPDLVIAMIDIEGGVPWIVILILQGLMEWPFRSGLLAETSNPDVRLVRRLLPY